MSDIPQFDPKSAIFSYCSDATSFLPFLSAKIFEHFMEHPLTQGSPLFASPPLFTISSATFSPEILSASSKLPLEKFRVGSIPRLLHMESTAGVPKSWRFSVLGSSLMIFATSLAAELSAFLSYISGFFLSESSITIAFMPLEPITAPMPPLPATRSCWPVWSVVATQAEARPISPAGPMQYMPTFLPNLSKRILKVSDTSLPLSPGKLIISASPSFKYRTPVAGSSGMSSSIMALNPRFESFLPAAPPTLLSFMPPVRGLFPPTEERPEVVSAVSPRSPEATINLFFLPRGSQAGSLLSSI